MSDSEPPDDRNRRLRVAQLEREVKDLTEERDFDKRIIEELHAKIERLENKLFPDPHLLARRIHETLQDLGSAPGGETWLLAPADWRRRLLRLIENFYCL